MPRLKTWMSYLPDSERRYSERSKGCSTGLHGDIKRLRESKIAYRLRMGDYRVLFDVQEGVIVIRRVGHRKNIYE